MDGQGQYRASNRTASYTVLTPERGEGNVARAGVLIRVRMDGPFFALERREPVTRENPMQFGDGGRSPNLEDDRGGGGGGGGGRVVGIGGSAVLLVLSLLFGRNLFTDAGVTPSV